MSITSLTQTRVGHVTTVTAVSDLTAPSGGFVYYCWYVDGTYVAMTVAATRTFYLGSGDQVRIEVTDTTDADYDAAGNAPDGYPARRTLWWLRSVVDDVDHYRVEQKKDADDFATIGIIQHDETRWSYSLLTPRLVDLSTYEWRIVPVDPTGNDGAILTIGPEKIVRTPDAPNVTATFDEGTSKVTFAAA